MDLNNLINSIQIDLEYSGVNVKTGVIQIMLNDEYRELQSSREWSWGTYSGAVASLHVGQSTYNLPSDYAGFLVGENGRASVLLSDITNNVDKPLNFETLGMLLRRDRNRNGTPERFSIDGLILYVDPPPDSSWESDVVKMAYVKAFTPLKSPDDIPIFNQNHHNILRHMVLRRAYRNAGLMNHMTVEEGFYQRALASLVMEEVKGTTTKVFPVFNS